MAVILIASALDPLNEFQRNRILKWAQDRYGTSLETLIEQFDARQVQK